MDVFAADKGDTANISTMLSVVIDFSSGGSLYSHSP
jgi:hypothetical protein